MGAHQRCFISSSSSDEARELFRSSPYQFYKRILEGSFQFIGITDATMTHGEGWDFIQLGKFIERADRTSRILDVKYHILLPSGERVGGNVDTVQWMAVLRSCSALEAYTKLYVGQIAPWKVAEFLILHDCVPARIAALRASGGLRAAPHQRRAGRPFLQRNRAADSGKLRSDLDYTRIGEVFQSGLHQYLDRHAAAAHGDQRRGGRDLLRDPSRPRNASRSPSRQSQTGGRFAHPSPRVRTSRGALGTLR